MSDHLAVTRAEAAYRQHHARLVRGLARTVPHADAEDVAAPAWAIALRRGIGGDLRAYVWVAAKRLAWRLAQRQHHDASGRRRRTRGCPRPPRRVGRPTPGDARPPGRQRRLVGPSAFGLDRERIAATTGDSWRTVDRELGRARRRLRAQLDA